MKVGLMKIGDTSTVIRVLSVACGVLKHRRNVLCHAGVWAAVV